MKNRNSRGYLVLFFLCSLFTMFLSMKAAFAQAGRGGISGTITDPSGAVVPKAKVVALNVSTGTSQQTYTSAAGVYSFVSKDPGTYEITVSVKGFQSVDEKDVTVTVDQVSQVNIALHLGNASDVVTVTAANDLLDTSSSTVGQLISAATIDRVPLLSRNVYDLVQLSAGVTPANGTPNSSSSFAITNISSGRPGVDVSSYTINGAIVGSVYYMVDGSPLGISENNVAAIIPALDIPEDAVDEFRVETQNTPASFQSGGAGVISLASKAGGDSFHGDGFVYIRPDVLAANDYFNKRSQLETPGEKNESPAFHRYQEGGSIGGPILHKKLFFFGDYEATQQELFDGSNTFTVPTTAERTGDFSADSFGIYNPLVPENPDGTRQQFPNNRIPNPNPTALKFLSEMPKCNAPNPNTCDAQTNGALNNFYLPGLDPTTAQRFDIRGDYYLSDKQRLFSRFSFDRLYNSTFNAFGNEWDLNFAQNITNGRNVVFGDDYTFNPTTVLQLRYSFTRHYEDQSGDPAQNGYSLTSLGFPASLAAQEVYKTLPYVQFGDVGGGVGGTANYNTFQYASENSDINGTVTKSFGKHELSFGGEYMKRFMNVGQPGAPSGAYAFDLSATDQQAFGAGGSDFASFLTGVGEAPGNESTNFTKDLFVAEASPYYAAFIEDTYRPLPNLTITAGLRWDIFGGKTERHNRLEYFDPNATNTVAGVAYTGAEVYANGNARSPFKTNLKDFGPRLAMSWQPSKPVVFRGGFGIYYGPSAQMVGGAALDSDGYSSITNWNATCYTAFGNTTLNGSNLCASAGAGSVAPSPTGPYSLSNPFPQGVVPLIANPTGLGNNLGVVLTTMLHSQRTQTIYNFNFGMEWEIPHGYVFSVGYVGSRGLFLPFGGVDLNQLDLATIGKYKASLVDTVVPNRWAATQPATNNNFGSPTVPLYQSLEAFPQFGDGNYGDGVAVNGYPAGDSEYSSLQTKIQKRLTSHFTALASFTWAKLMTDDGNPPLGFVGSHAGGAQDWRDLYLEHSVSPQDVKYQFTGQASYDLPIGRDRAVRLNRATDLVLGGWTANGIFYLSTGIPIASPGSGGNLLAENSNDPGVIQGYISQRPNLNCDPGVGAPHTVDRWFNYSCFSLPASPFVAGTAPAYLDHVRTMGADDVDITLFKSFSLPREMNLRFEVSAFNIANRVQLGGPNTPSIFSLTNPAPGALPQDMSYQQQFGQINYDVNTPRQFQVASKFTF